MTINCWAKDLTASVAVNYNTGAYAFDSDSNLAHTEKDALSKCEKNAKRLNKANKLNYNEKDLSCKVIAQLNSKQCITFATDENGSFGWTIIDGKYIQDNMRLRSLNQCTKRSGIFCHIAIEFCTK